ncbi:MAG: hypothetical protein IKW80_08750, partial [Thermoguttaceae bacterium]|nr:hypothetical protein [Thermoguttaceae bacterium]
DLAIILLLLLGKTGKRLLKRLLRRYAPLQNSNRFFTLITLYTQIGNRKAVSGKIFEKSEKL